MTPEEAESAGYHAWAATDTAAYANAVASAKAASFDPDILNARLAMLESVAERCVMSKTYATFWQRVQTQT